VAGKQDPAHDDCLRHALTGNNSRPTRAHAGYSAASDVCCRWYFGQPNGDLSLQFWAGVEINRKKWDDLAKLAKCAGYELSIVDGKAYIGAERDWLPESAKRRWYMSHTRSNYTAYTP
jgi:hypothetical protein